MLRLIFLIWEFPQNFLGLIVFAVMRHKHKVISTEKESRHLFIETPVTGVSLGYFIFWTPAGNRFSHLINDCRMHEYGHSRQSALLGPLYLVVVGIPSLARVLYGMRFKRKFGYQWPNYFNAFPESWADKLGGVSSGESHQ